LFISEHATVCADIVSVKKYGLFTYGKDGSNFFTEFWPGSKEHMPE